MRGELTDQQAMFSSVSPEARVPATHPLRAITVKADEVLATLERTFDTMDSHTGRPSIPPERLLKSELLIALFSIRSHRLFCEELNDNILLRWFLDMSLDEPGFDHSTFGQNSERLLQHEVARRFCDAVVTAARSIRPISSARPTTCCGSVGCAPGPARPERSRGACPWD